MRGFEIVSTRCDARREISRFSSKEARENESRAGNHCNIANKGHQVFFYVCPIEAELVQLVQLLGGANPLIPLI